MTDQPGRQLTPLHRILRGVIGLLSLAISMWALADAPDLSYRSILGWAVVGGAAITGMVLVAIGIRSVTSR